MVRFLWIGLLFHTVLGALCAQKKVLPVRIDGKWGYISITGKVVVPPKYDALAEENTPYYGPGKQRPSEYRMVSVGDRCGLLDKYRRETFAPVYQRIHILTDTLFAVRTDSGYYVVNQHARVLRDVGAWDDVQAPEPGNKAWTGLLLVKKDFKWGIIDLEGNIKLPAQYAEVWPQRDCPGLFVVSNQMGGPKGMVDAQNKIVLRLEYLDLMALQDNCLAVKDLEGWSITGRSGQQQSIDKYVDVRRINRHFYALTQGNGSALFSVKDKKIVAGMNFNFRYVAIDDDYMAKTRPDTLPVSVIAPSAKVLKIGRFEVISMLPASMGYYPVSIYGNVNKRFWGLWKPGTDSLSAACVYTKIHPFKDSLAIVELDKKQGVLNNRLQEIIPPVFNAIVVEGNSIKARTDTSLVLFEINADRQISKAESFGNVLTIKVAEPDSFLELARTPIPRRFEYADYDLERERFSIIAMHGFSWVLDKASNLYGLRKGDSLLLAPFAEQVVLVGNRDLGLVFTREKTTRNAFTHMAIRDRQTPLCRMALFDFIEGRFITDFTYLGLRYRDFITQNAAVFVDLEGKMGLITSAGVEMKTPGGQPFRSTFIDEFTDGKARFAATGKLVSIEENDANRTWPMPPLNYHFEFTAPHEAPVSMRFQEYCIEPVATADSVRWGVIDSLGQMVIPPRYDYIQDVTGSGIIARKGFNWGVLDFKGDTILGFRYRWISDYGNYWKIVLRDPNEFFFPYAQKAAGVAATGNRFPVLQDSLWGYADPGGRMAIAPVYRAAGLFDQGLALVFMRDAPALIDTLGNAVVAPGIYKTIKRVPGTTLLGVQQNKSKSWEILDPGSKDAPKQSWEYFDPIAPGLIKVGNQKKYGLVNAAGKIIVPVQYADIQWLDGSTLALKSADANKYFLVDTAGRRLSKMSADKIFPFYNNRAIAQMGGYSCLIDKKGQYQPLYGKDRALCWSEGFAAVDISNRRTGKNTRNKFAYLNSEGVDEFGLACFDIKPFQNGIGQVRKGYFWGTINRFGLYISPPKYVKIDIRPDGVHVKVPTMMGLTDKRGNIILPAKYDRVEIVGGAYFRVERGDKVGYRKLNGDWVWKLD